MQLCKYKYEQFHMLFQNQQITPAFSKVWQQGGSVLDIIWKIFQKSVSSPKQPLRGNKNTYSAFFRGVFKKETTTPTTKLYPMCRVAKQLYTNDWVLLQSSPIRLTAKILHRLQKWSKIAEWQYNVRMLESPESNITVKKASYNDAQVIANFVSYLPQTLRNPFNYIIWYY